MRSYYIAGNWKMHKTVGESVALAKALVIRALGLQGEGHDRAGFHLPGGGVRRSSGAQN